MSNAAVLASSVGSVNGIGPTALRTLLVRMGRPDVLVAGDSLMDQWLEKHKGIPQKDKKVDAERERVNATAAWRPWRSVAYLLINAAQGASVAPVLHV